MLCKVCGAQIPDDAQECEFCGTKVNEDASAAEETKVINTDEIENASDTWRVFLYGKKIKIFTPAKVNYYQ